MSELRNTVNIEKNRAHIIDMITVETHAPVDEVKRVFDAELSRLKSGARVFDFLEVLAIKNTLQTLAKMH